MTEPPANSDPSPSTSEPSSEDADQEPPKTPDPEPHETPSADDDNHDPQDALGDMLRPAGRASAVVGSVRARTSFVGTTNIGSVVIEAAHRGLRVPLTDLLALHATGPFVPPPGYDELVTALASSRVIVCHGPSGCGKERAVTRALLKTGAESVKLVPGALSLLETAQVVESLAKDGGGCVLQLDGQAALRSLAGSAGQSIRAVAASGRLTVVVLSAVPPPDAARRDLASVELAYPDQDATTKAYLTAVSAPEQVVRGVAEVLARIHSQIGPADVSMIVSDVAANPGIEADDVAASFDASVPAAAVSQWLDEGRLPREVAAFAAGVALSGASSVVVQDQADVLADALEEGDPPQSELVRGMSPWPSGFLQTRRDRIPTHFGVQELEVVAVDPHHRPQDLVQALWAVLGPKFRSNFGDWLLTLPDSPGLGWHAAYTAGALFAADPVLVEAQVLRPWAKSVKAPLRRCAGVALGTPIAMGADPSASRALAHSWASSSSPHLQHAAVSAYGGLLGAWDAPSAAPLKLFRIGQVNLALRREADWGLASLIVAGREASSSRSWTLGYLKLVSGDPFLQPRVFGCLPRIAAALVAPNAVCVESLSALRGESEAWSTLHELLGTALVTPAGVAAGRDSIELVITAVARDHVEIEVAEELVRGMRGMQRQRGTVGKLGTVLRRSLAAVGRSGNDEEKAVATALMTRFFQ
jgi:hypothetical protein